MGSDGTSIKLTISFFYCDRMPRQTRIDAPGAHYHIIIREIERKNIFNDDSDRDDFSSG